MLEGKRILRQAFKDLERELPQRVARGMRGLRHPKARYIRIPVAVLSIVGGVFSFLPVLGLWMLPLGLLLLAHDVPFLRKPVGRFTSWGAQRWAKFRRPSRSDEASSNPHTPNLATPPVAVMSAADLKPNPADPLSNPTPTPGIVPTEEPPQQLPNITSHRSQILRELRPQFVHRLGQIIPSGRLSPLNTTREGW